MASRAGAETFGDPFVNALVALWCRLLGRPCASKRPASRDIFNEMRERGRRVDAQTAEIRRERTQGISDALYPPLRNGGRRR